MGGSRYPLESRGLNAQQVAKVREFKALLESSGLWDPAKHDEHDAARFLKARNYDLSHAKQMWEAMLHWRKEMRADSINEWFNFTERDAYNRIYPTGLHKIDREGHPVLIQRLGRVDLKALYKVTTEERLKYNHIKEYEHLRSNIFPLCSRLSNRHVDQLFIIIDLDGVSFTDMMRTRTLLTMFMKMDSDNYPEILYRMIIINAPGWFSNMWSSIKSFMSGDTPKKIEIVGKDFRPVLLKYIAPENLLPDFGGTSAGALTDSVGPWQGVSLSAIAEEPNEGADASIRGAGSGGGAVAGGSPMQVTERTSSSTAAGPRPMDLDGLGSPEMPAGATPVSASRSGSAAPSRSGSPTRREKAHAMATKITTTAKAAAAAARDMMASVTGSDREHKLEAPLLGKHYRSSSQADGADDQHRPGHIVLDLDNMQQRTGATSSSGAGMNPDSPNGVTMLPFAHSPQTSDGSSGPAGPHGAAGTEMREMGSYGHDQDRDLNRNSVTSQHSYYSAVSEYPSTSSMASPHGRDSDVLRRYSRDMGPGPAAVHGGHMHHPATVMAPSRSGAQTPPVHGGSAALPAPPTAESPFPRGGARSSSNSPTGPARAGPGGEAMDRCGLGPSWARTWFRRRQASYRQASDRDYGSDVEAGMMHEVGATSPSKILPKQPSVYYAKHALHPDYFEFDQPSPITDQMLQSSSSYEGMTQRNVSERRRLLAASGSESGGQGYGQDSDRAGCLSRCCVVM